MKVKEYISKVAVNQYHIFDSHQEAMNERGVMHADRDYAAYSYNIHKNNKPKVGDAFLYRRPGKSSPSRKFYIYGGGIISSISNPDKDGNVLAGIEKPFKLNEPLFQTDTKTLEDFEWTSKNKVKGSWAHFFSQYGMNVIDEHDFFGLVGELECSIPGDINLLPASPKESAEEENEIDDINISGFNIVVTENNASGRMPIASGTRNVIGNHIDYNALGRKKTTIGQAGELLVVEMLIEQLNSSEALIEHTSKIKGDGLGYDIKVTYSDGHETQIEVKTTKGAYIDGFYITPSELNASRKAEDYQIYRVYNFDPINKSANIEIYHAPFKDEEFRFVPVAWKVHLR
jgi:hypothetical protein